MLISLCHLVAPAVISELWVEQSAASMTEFNCSSAYPDVAGWELSLLLIATLSFRENNELAPQQILSGFWEAMNAIGILLCI